MSYDDDYPKSRIGGNNPYMKCTECGVSQPEINGNIYNHEEWCSYRIRKVSELLYPNKLREILERFGVMDDELYAAIDDLLDDAYYSAN
jgi:hypothetical protein